MSNDSVDQWGQVLSGKFVDSHPAFHTLIIWLLTRVWLHPAVISSAQIIGLGTLTAFIFHRFEKLGVPRKILAIATL